VARPDHARGHVRGVDDQDYALVVYGATDLLSDGPMFADDFEDGTTGAWSRVIP
jgi:hypothetical protein